MGLGEVTLAALALAVILSCTSRLNVGLLAIALAWVIGVYVGHLPLRDVTAGFPVDLFLTLSGVTLLFSQAHVNGTLDIVAHNAMRLCRGRVGLVPIMYFALGAAIASAGPGNIATTGLLAPVAMATALRMRISPFLMAIMVGNGCNSGSLSPLAPTGLIVTGLMNRIGLPGSYDYTTPAVSNSVFDGVQSALAFCQLVAHFQQLHQVLGQLLGDVFDRVDRRVVVGDVHVDLIKSSR